MERMEFGCVGVTEGSMERDSADLPVRVHGNVLP